ncbi:MAG: DUF4401 domain-containing protein [Pseudomonadota bacterium]
MSNVASNSLWSALASHSLVRGEPPSREPLSSPWYINALIAVSGWLAALFLMGFLGVAMTFVLKEPWVSGILSVPTLIGARWLIANGANDFYRHLGLAISLVGQSLFIWATFHIDESPRTVWLSAIFVSVILAFAMPHTLHRAFSTFAALVSLGLLLSEMSLHYVAPAIALGVGAFSALYEFDTRRWVMAMMPFSIGAIFATFALVTADIYGATTTFANWDQGVPPALRYVWVGDVAMVLVLIGTVRDILRRYQQPMTSRAGKFALAGGVIAGGASLLAPGIVAATTVIALGFATAERFVTGLGILALLFYLGNYYYQLDITLLAKAGVLALMAIILGCLAWLHRRLHPRKEVMG